MDRRNSWHLITTWSDIKLPTLTFRTKSVTGRYQYIQCVPKYMSRASIIGWCERIEKTVSIGGPDVHLHQSQDVQVITFYEVMNKMAFIANRPAIFKSEIG